MMDQADMMNNKFNYDGFKKKMKTDDSLSSFPVSDADCPEHKILLAQTIFEALI